MNNPVCKDCATNEAYKQLEAENKEMKEENELYRKFTDKVRRIIKHEKENGCLECETRNDGNCGKCAIGKIEKLVWLDKE